MDFVEILEKRLMILDHQITNSLAQYNGFLGAKKFAQELLDHIKNPPEVSDAAELDKRKK